MKLLILTVSAGEGHNSMSRAISNYIKEAYKDAEIKQVDLFKDGDKTKKKKRANCDGGIERILLCTPAEREVVLLAEGIAGAVTLYVVIVAVTHSRKSRELCVHFRLSHLSCITAQESTDTLGSKCVVIQQSLGVCRCSGPLQVRVLGSPLALEFHHSGGIGQILIGHDIE